LLNARALAYWIMDDGGIDSFCEAATHLYTDKFSLNCINLLQLALKDNFNLRTRIYQKQTDQWVIVIPVLQIQTLASIVGPYMHPTFRYKVKGLN
jgi:hypothetical protein